MGAAERQREQLFIKLLNIHFIFCKIASGLSLKDLINCTAVSSLFYVKFREYLYTKRTCDIRIRWDDSPCRQLKELNELLVNATVVLPYNGITCSDEKAAETICSPQYHEDICLESFGTLLSKVRFTSFVFYSKNGLNCPANQFLNYVLKYKASELTTLNVHNTPWVFTSLWQHLNIQEETRPTWFANVHTINLVNMDEEGYNPLHLEEILESCPNLKRLTGRFRSYFLAPRPKSLGPPDEIIFGIPRSIFGLIPKNKYKCITDCYDLSPSQLLLLAKETPKLKTLSLLLGPCGSLPYEQNYNSRINERIYDIQKTGIALHNLFLSSWNFLDKLICSIGQLLMIQQIINSMNSDSSSFPVSKLELTSGTSKEYEAFLYLRCIDFSRILSRLAHVSVHPFPNSEIIDSSLISNVGKCNNTCTSVTSLAIHGSYIPEENLRVVASLFPNVQDLEVHNTWQEKEMCASLWNTDWDKIKSIKFCALEIDADLDDIFFGLPPVERQFIESQNLNLEYFEFVPMKGSAFNFKGLITIHLELVTYDRHPYQRISRSFPLLSALTAQRISKQLPHLTMKIVIDKSIKFEKSNSEQISINQYAMATKNPDHEYIECNHKHFYTARFRRPPYVSMYTLRFL
ncbi:unnamed protein product [Allacma fusca]|uniref:Uncharacterized protein n=1 Tax=Allacma fusca TaxID=39272 RepID=A0A8J2JR54_9HEXA|nr:unnamed protein product [Allacma fusca]